MSQFQPRPTIPYEWGEKARCPACSAPDMEVQHQAAGPDQLRCTACGLRLELELGGSHLRVMRWPDLQRPDSVPQPGSWMSIEELRSVLKHGMPASPPAASVQSVPAPASPALDDLTARVQKLVDLGSSPMEVRASVAGSGLSREQVEQAMRSASQAAGKERRHQERKLWGWLALLALLLPLLIWGGIRLGETLAGKQEEFIAALRSTLAPGMIQAAGMTTPVVKQLDDPPGAASGTAVPCPATPAQAAGLFGGRAETWSSGPNGWIRVDTSGEDATIYVPYGMVGAYFRVGDQLVLVEVQGPATLSQAPAVAISCP